MCEIMPPMPANWYSKTQKRLPDAEKMMQKKERKIA